MCCAKAYEVKSKEVWVDKILRVRGGSPPVWAEDMGHAWASLWDVEKYVWGVEQNEPKILGRGWEMAPNPHITTTCMRCSFFDIDIALLSVRLSVRLYHVVICPIAIPYHGTDYQISFLSVYVCIYVCVSVGTLTVAFFNRSSRNLVRTFGVWIGRTD